MKPAPKIRQNQAPVSLTPCFSKVTGDAAGDSNRFNGFFDSPTPAGRLSRQNFKWGSS